MSNRLVIEKIRDVKDPLMSSFGSAGIDFYIPNKWNDGKDYLIGPRKDVLIPLGIKVQVPDFHALIAFNKSGVAVKQKLINGAVVVDADYRGEIHAHMINYSDRTQVIKCGQKITQFILQRYTTPHIVYDKVKDNTKRGSGGFGSTGLV